jgi:hypothetical protein
LLVTGGAGASWRPVRYILGAAAADQHKSKQRFDEEKREREREHSLIIQMKSCLGELFWIYWRTPSGEGKKVNDISPISHDDRNLVTNHHVL